MTVAKTKRTMSLLAALVSAAGIAGCAIGSNPDFSLDVPFRSQQLNSFDCGPASVQMWALYDFASAPSQQTISAFMGGTTFGASEQEIADAVNRFTGTSDAYWDFTAYNDYKAFMSRQITSLNNYNPVIAIIDFNHAGVVNGGNWLRLTNAYQWEYVYFHDPLSGPNRLYSSLSWIENNCPSPQVCSQIISVGSSGGWSQNLADFGDIIYNSGGYIPPDEQN